MAPYQPVISPRIFLYIISLLFLVGSLSSNKSLAQAKKTSPQYAKHSVYLELGGNAGLYTVNYDRKFTDHFSGRAGFMVFGGQSDQPTDDRIGVAILPITANYLAGSGSHRLELGAGPLFMAAGGELERYGSVGEAGLAGVTSTFGYRYQSIDGGFVFRIGLVPFYSASRPQLWAGLSLGYSF